MQHPPGVVMDDFMTFHWPCVPTCYSSESSGMCKLLRTSPLATVTLLCVFLFVCNVGAAAVGAVSEPHRQVADEAERLPNIDLQVRAMAPSNGINSVQFRNEWPSEFHSSVARQHKLN